MRNRSRVAAFLLVAGFGIALAAIRWRSPVDLSTRQDLFASWLGWVWVVVWSALALPRLGHEQDRQRIRPTTILLMALGCVCFSIALYYVLIVEILNQSYDDFFGSAQPYGLARWSLGLLTSTALVAAAVAAPIACVIAWRKRGARDGASGALPPES